MGYFLEEMLPYRCDGVRLADDRLQECGKGGISALLR